MSRTVGGLLLLLLALLVLPALAAEDRPKDTPAKPAEEKIAIDNPAPDIEGADVDGKKFKLSDYKGKVVLLDFWGNW